MVSGSRPWQDCQTKSGPENERESKFAIFHHIGFVEITKLQLFLQRLSHKSVKAYATMPIGIMGRRSLPLIDRGSRCLCTYQCKPQGGGGGLPAGI